MFLFWLRARTGKPTAFLMMAAKILIIFQIAKFKCNFLWHLAEISHGIWRKNRVAFGDVSSQYDEIESKQKS